MDIRMNYKTILAKNVTALMETDETLDSHAKIAKRSRKTPLKISARAVGYMLDIEEKRQPKLDSIVAVANVFKVAPWLLLTPDFDASTRGAKELPPPEIIALAARIHAMDRESLEDLRDLFQDAVPDHEVEGAGYPSQSHQAQQPRAKYDKQPRQMKMKLKP